MFKEIFNNILKDLGISLHNRPEVLECPNCNQLMKRLSIRFKGGYETIQLDFCQDCEGIWFDRGELIKTLEIDIKDISKYFPSKTKQSYKGTGKRFCPVCQKMMTLINYSKDSNIWVDICSNGCGIFLDAGELELIKIYSINPDALKTSSHSAQLSQEQNKDQQLVNEIQNIAIKINNIKKKLIDKIKQIEQALENKDVSKLKTFLNKEIFKEELSETGELSLQIRNLYQKYGNQRQIEDLQNSIQSIIKFIDIKNESITKRVSSEVEIERQVTQSKILQPTEIKPTETKPAETKTSEIKTTESKLTETKLTETKPTETKTIESKIAESKTTETKTSKSEKNFEIQKIRVSGFENLHSYCLINNNFYIFSDSKIFVKKGNTFEEIRIREINFRIKKVKVIDNSLFILGSSGSIAKLSLSLEYENIYKVGYSDIVDLVKLQSKFFALSSNRIHILDNDFKLLQEKNINTNFIHEHENMLLAGSNNLFILDPDLNKIQDYSMGGSFQQIKKIKLINNEVFLLGSGILAKFDFNNITKFNLPKSYLEINDIQKINDIYYIASNSGGFFYSTDLNNFNEIKLGIFDNIYSIAYFEDKIYLLCANSNIILLKEI